MSTLPDETDPALPASTDGSAPDDTSTLPAPDDREAGPHPRIEAALVKRIVEAALLAANHPLTVVQLNGLFPLDAPAPDGSVQQALTDLQAESNARGVELVEVASGWRYQIKADVHAWVARLWSERQTRYTRATLETLALIAYRQPITRGEIEQVRGVATNSNIIKALEEREWIRVVGHRDVPGRPELLGTTKGFLDYFGLKRLDELPPLSELKDFGALEPELDLGPADKALGDLPSEDDGKTSASAEGGDQSVEDTDNAVSPRDEAHPDDGHPIDTDTESPPHAAPSSEDAQTPDHNALAGDGDSTRSTP